MCPGTSRSTAMTAADLGFSSSQPVQTISGEPVLFPQRRRTRNAEVSCFPRNRIETDVGLSAKISCTFSHGIDGWASPASILKYIMGTPRLRKTGRQKNRSTAASPQAAQMIPRNQRTLPSPRNRFPIHARSYDRCAPAPWLDSPSSLTLPLPSQRENLLAYPPNGT